MRNTYERTLPPSPNGCRHHWLIDPPAGPKSLGVCKLCGQQRYFRNHLPELDSKIDMLHEQAKPSAIILGKRRIDTIYD